MNRLTIGARATLVNLVSLLLTGRGLPAEERSRLVELLRLSGFRSSLRHAILGMLTGGGRRQGETSIIAPVLDGTVRLALAADDSGIGLEILATGTYEPHVVRFYRRTLRPGMTVLDAGANIGFHALHAALLVRPSGRVIAVEPDPRNASLLRESVALASAPLAVQVVEAALSDSDGTLLLSDLGNPANSGARFTHAERPVLEKLVHGPSPVFREVRAFRWDSRFLDTALDLVKIDVEGHEPQVVRGMERSLARHRPILLAEFAPSNLRQLGGIEPLAWLSWMRGRGYRPAVLGDDGECADEDGDAAILAALDRRHHLDLVFRPTERA